VERALDFAPVAFLVARECADRTELCHSWQAVLALGGQPVLLSPLGGEVELIRGPVPGGSMHVDVEVLDATATDFVGLVLPDDDGAAEPSAQHSGDDGGVVALVRAFFAAGLPVAAIGGAARILAAADTVCGRLVTSAPKLRAELARAGASWTGERVVVCERGRSVLVTAQDRSDLPVFCRAFTRRFFALA
jgi:protease I